MRRRRFRERQQRRHGTGLSDALHWRRRRRRWLAVGHRPEVRSVPVVGDDVDDVRPDEELCDAIAARAQYVSVELMTAAAALAHNIVIVGHANQPQPPNSMAPLVLVLVLMSSLCESGLVLVLCVCALDLCVLICNVIACVYTNASM